MSVACVGDLNRPRSTGKVRLIVGRQLLYELSTSEVHVCVTIIVTNPQVVVLAQCYEVTNLRTILHAIANDE